MIRSRIHSLLLASTLAFSVGCTKDSSDDGTSNEDGSFKTSCGTVYKGSLENPIDKGDAKKGTVTVLGSNLLLFKSSSQTNLVKLQNIGAQGQEAKAKASMNKLSSLAAQGEVYYYQATKDCEAEVESGASGQIGQIFSANGANFSETLINAGLAKLDTDQCDGSLLSSCYNALEDQAQQTIAAELTQFLWKPVSDSNGKLAVHVGPYDTKVFVNGIEGSMQGSGNGYGDLARFPQPGCAYGAATVKVVDAKTGAAYTFNGSDTINIPNGCNRYCIKEGSLQVCPKS